VQTEYQNIKKNKKLISVYLTFSYHANYFVKLSLRFLFFHSFSQYFVRSILFKNREIVMVWHREDSTLSIK